MKSRWMLVLILVVLLFAGCGKNSDEDKGTLTPTGAGKATATPAITPAEMTSTPTPSAEPTATPTPTIAIPGRPEEYQIKAFVQEAEAEMSGFQYAYREIMTLSNPTDENIGDPYSLTTVALGRDTRAVDPWELFPVATYEKGFVYNSTVSYLDADLNCLKCRYLLNGTEVMVMYYTSLGKVFCCPDGTVLYEFRFKKYDDDGRLLIKFNHYCDYQCYTYDEAGRLLAEAVYTNVYTDESLFDSMITELDEYTVYTYDKSGRLQQKVTCYPTVEPELQIRHVYTYDEDGNCVSDEGDVRGSDDIEQSSWRYDFLYSKDERGRLSSLKCLEHSGSGGPVIETIIDFHYYDDGAILVTERTTDQSPRSVMVVYPDERMEEFVRICTNLDPVIYIRSLGSFASGFPGYPTVEDRRDGVSRYQGLPVTDMPETRPLVVYYDWDDDALDALLQVQTFDSQTFEFMAGDDNALIPYYSGYRDGRLEEFSAFDGDSGIASVFEYDSEHRPVRWVKEVVQHRYDVWVKEVGTIEYRYDVNGHLIEQISNLVGHGGGYPDVNAVSRYSYDPDGKLIEASIVESCQDPVDKMVTRTTTFLFEYSGDGTD